MTLLYQPQTEAFCSPVLSHLTLNTCLFRLNLYTVYGFNLEATISIVSTDVATTRLHANPSLNIHYVAD